ncbi:hypothetical protein M1P56_31415 [Streptomyces sp. HU2014]|uniref:Uncharacterized protein n=1 Tax=Streptomyces albireticuli TaxID=1940 RepID=A0A1Z2L2Q3_9ACTN|nr:MULTISPECIES: hypothetical protein [Streptomyces]ARZ68573.1 hypothetical protein SMD11_2926 [Streptomyces albireticuli]UQI48510.1 hypothetical protein M1P56_31415 [Streptomyces sp. HU2014]
MTKTRELPPRTAAPTPRWANLVAHAIPLLLLPQCLWRLPFAFHFEMGMVHQKDMPSMWISVPYVFGLSVITETLALLSFGLVRGWGEVAPAWLPFIGGKRLRPMAVIIPATLGGLGATAFWMPTVLSWFGVLSPGAGFTSDGWQALARVCVAPGTLWGPLVLVLTYAYYVRRCRPAKGTGEAPAAKSLHGSAVPGPANGG